MRRNLILFALLAACAVPLIVRADSDGQAHSGLSIVEGAANKSGDRMFTIQADRIEINDLLRTMFKKVDAEVAVDQDVSGPVTLVIKDVTFKDALQWIVQVARPPIKITRSKTDSVYHVSRDQSAERAANAANAIQNRMDALGGGMAGQGPPGIVPSPGVGNTLRPLAGMPGDRMVSLDVPLNRPILLSDALTRIASQSHVPINLDARIPRDLTFTGRISQAPISLVLETIAATSGLKLVTSGAQATFVPTDEFQIRLNGAILGQSSSIPCPRCGQPVAPGWRFCPNCGLQIQQVPGTAQQGQQNSQSQRNRRAP